MDLKRGLEIRRKLSKVLNFLPPEPPETPSAWLRALLRATIEAGASDLDLVDGQPPAFLLDGDVVPLYDVSDPNDWETPALAEVLASAIPKPVLDGVLKRELLDRDLAITVPELGRFRVNLHYQSGSLAAVFRVIPTEPPKYAELGLPASVRQAATRNAGLFLVTGATGSGKSTTLAAIVDYINATRPVKIVTIEDPVEFLYPPRRARIAQREVGSDTRSFAVALKSALRQAPHVILLGEMRDAETIALALTAAETGHLVLATLHTHSAAGAVHRIVDAFTGNQQATVRSILAATLNGVLAQQLVPRKNGDGRVLVYEFLRGTPAVRNLIREGKVADIANQMQAESNAHVLLKDVVNRLVEAGEIDPLNVGQL